MVPMSYWRCPWSLVQVKEVTFEEKSLPDQVLISHRQGTMMGSVTLLCAKHHNAFYFLDHAMGLSRSGNEITGMCPNSILSCCNWFCITSCTAVNTVHHHQNFCQGRICYEFPLSYVLLCVYIYIHICLIFPFFIFDILLHLVSPPLSAQWVFICHLNPLKLSGYFMYHQI